MLKIRDISDKGKKNRKGLRYEVCLCHSDAKNSPEVEVVAKFKPL